MVEVYGLRVLSHPPSAGLLCKGVVELFEDRHGLMIGSFEFDSEMCSAT